jgi:hypothetical protein
VSIYYYIVCDKCREIADLASVGASGQPVALVDSPTTLVPFLLTHGGCAALRVISEHDEIPMEYIEWTAKNLDEMLDKERHRE